MSFGPKSDESIFTSEAISQKFHASFVDGASIVSSIEINETLVVISRFEDDKWWLDGIPTNQSDSGRSINFSTTPINFRALVKHLLFRYLKHGRAGLPQPKGSSIKNLYEKSKKFFLYLESVKVKKLADTRQFVISNYVDKIRNHKTWRGKGYSQASLLQQFLAVEAIYELSQYTGDAMPFHPWPDSSAQVLAGVGKRSGANRQAKTPLMPDDVFCKVFDLANKVLEAAPRILDIRDASVLADFESRLPAPKRTALRKARMRTAGWEGTSQELHRETLDVRTACYVILAATSGCRNHELANLTYGSHHKTSDSEGNIYHWMRSKSEKTDAGIIDWMIPEIAVRAIRLMERWATPFQATLREEIKARTVNNPLDPLISEATKHANSLFLSNSKRRMDRVRVLSLRSWAHSIKEFAEKADIDWDLTSHQFRRKFANYAAHSKFGDLRYLKEHFAHWSMDMTIPYAMDESWGHHLDIDLFNEIEHEFESTKLSTVDRWISQPSLSGGQGLALKSWQRDPKNLTMFKSHSTMIKSISDTIAIRSNGHAWCTADKSGCIGNSLEPTRCGGCINGVIGDEHAHIYIHMQDNLTELLKCKDIGAAGVQRVTRDLNRCQQVLADLRIPT